MEDETKTKRQLIAELIDARRQIDELENMISKYKESLEALRQNEERYQLLTTTLNDVIWTMSDRARSINCLALYRRLIS
jgi:PAS domain-containing protein